MVFEEMIGQSDALESFTRYLRLLHRLSTTPHHSIEDSIADYLQTGCEIFAVPNGMLTSFENGSLRVSHTHRESILYPIGGAVPALAAGDRTVVCAGDGCVHRFFVSAPICLDNELYGSLAFWSDEVDAQLDLHPHAREVIELMAKGLGVAIDQQRLTTQLAHQATHDSLTGLPNRLLLKERLHAALEWAAASETEAAVVFIDLDRFKEINDTLGHGIGDGVLQQVARQLESAMAPGDTLARMGGDEFTAIFTGFRSKEQAVERARSLLNAMRTPCRVEHYELFVTGSIGISFYPQDGRDAATLLRNADSAMYRAKALGKNEVHSFEAESTATALERLQLETSLRRALERREFDLMFQPQVEQDGRLAATEVLLVWNHPEQGRIPPTRFIPIAEETGMILAIGSWVLQESCRTMANWIAEGIQGVAISVNVSALQFAQLGFVASVAAALESTGLPPELLELEVTESVIMRDMQQSANVLRELRELGVKIAIDDFGTGYSSLNYLLRLPADSLKIDRSFMAEIESGDAAAIVRNIVTLGHALRLTVTAEGVETEAQWKMLCEAKCDRMQGHLIGAAMTAKTVRQMLAVNWRWS